MSDNSDLIDKIDKGLANYYNANGSTDYFDADGKGKFRVFCDDNGFEETEIIEEMANDDPNESLLPDFDDQFPGKKKDLAQILKIIKICSLQGAEASFGRTKTYTADKFQLTDQEKATYKNVYREQCTAAFLSPIEKDDAFYDAMMIGRKMNEPYIANLVDHYMRWRVKSYLKNKPSKHLTVYKWAQNHPHFRYLHSIDAKIKEKVVHAVKNSKRICPNLDFQPIAEIPGSLSRAADVIFYAAAFVEKKSKHPGCCPFQMDVCIGYRPFNYMDEKDDDSEDDDDDDDDDERSHRQRAKGHTVNDIGSISKKLENNQLKHCTVEDQRDRLFGSAYAKFAEEAQYEKRNPQNKRWVVFVDERKERKEDDKREMTMFTPPRDCDNIPKNAVNEWYFASTATCLIPNMGYKLRKMMSADENIEVDNVNQQNISSKVSAPVMTLSFHVKEEESISCYLYVLGQYMRFVASDIVDILPKLFVKSKENTEFLKELNTTIQNEKEKSMIEEIDDKLIDKNFDTFCTTYPIE